MANLRASSPVSVTSPAGSDQFTVLFGFFGSGVCSYSGQSSFTLIPPSASTSFASPSILISTTCWIGTPSVFSATALASAGLPPLYFV